MKQMYERPTMDVENFAANEFIASCGCSGDYYKFVCDAGGGKRGDIFLDSNNNGKLDLFDKNLTKDRVCCDRWFVACGATHLSPTDAIYPKGFYVANGGNDKTKGCGVCGKDEYEVIPVRVWQTKGGNVHATTNLEMDSWGTARS